MKSLAVALLIILSVAITQAKDSDAAVNNVERQGRTFDGGLTSGFTTALSSIGTIGGLSLILIGILLLPTIISLMIGTPLLGKRAFDDGFQMDKGTILSRLSMLHEAWQTFDVTDAQCRKRLICDVHAVEPELGPSARKLIKVMDYLSNAGHFNLPEPFGSIIREYMESTRAGKEFQGCTKYSSCPYSFATQMKRNF